jgi:hypothetical protein
MTFFNVVDISAIESTYSEEGKIIVAADLVNEEMTCIKLNQ